MDTYQNGFGLKVCSTEKFLNSEEKYIVDDDLTIDFKATFKLFEDSTIAVNESLNFQNLWNGDDKDFVFVIEQ